ncbi:lytic murein transglycosylase [Agrobacterium tumefaciens]|nr:lytic murein transglycosylase [Agrobacterium tumefaciens]
MRLTPLCPAGHLPLKGGDRQAALPPFHLRALREARPNHESISPLEGEMSGRTEGGEAAYTDTRYKSHPLKQAEPKPAP